MICAGENDVNEVAVDSSATTEVTQAEPQATPSEETLKTEVQAEHESHVPYDRFKEVNDKLRQIEEKSAKYLSNPDLYATYEQFDQVLMENPELADTVKQAIVEQMQNGEVTEQSQQDLGQQTQAGDPLAQKVAVGMYVNEFQKMAMADGVPGELLNEYGEFTRQELLKINPDPLTNFDMATLGQAYKTASQRMDTIIKFDRSKYVAEKRADQVPASTSSGQAPVTDVNLSDQNDRASYMANALKSAT